MYEADQVVTAGVEEVPVAEVHESATTEVNQQADTNTGVDTSEAAAQSDEKGFAKALKAREEQIRAQLQQEYGEKAKQAEQYQQMLDRTARFYNYSSHDEFMAALEQAEQDREIQEKAVSLGVDEEVIRNHLQPLNQKLSEYERQLTEIKQQEALRSVEAQLQDLSSKYSDFDKFKPQVFDLAMKGYSLEDAYKIASYDDRVNSAKLEAQQETIRNLNQNAASSTGALGADAPDPIAGYMGMSAAEKRAFREKVKSGR